MSKKQDWTETDKRIIRRKTSWTKEEKASLQASLKKLPDLSEEYEVVDIRQPAVGDEELAAEDAAATEEPAQAPS